MTGHHAGNAPRQAPPADPLLDQLAAHLAAARTTGNPAIAALATAETTFTANMLTRLEGLDAPTIGAVLLAAGYYAGEFLKTLRAEDTAGAPAAVVNLVQLAGQQLYTARVASKGVCGLAWPSGKACTQTFEADDDETLAAKMRGHAALSHPGQEWEAHTGDEPDDGDDLCACGKPAEVVVGTFNRPDGQPGKAKSQCLDCARRDAMEHSFAPPPTNPTYDEAKRYANVRAYAEYLFRAAAEIPSPVDGLTHPVSAADAWAEAVAFYAEWVPGATPRPNHAPHELCDCRPGETYHCAADSEAQS